MSVASNGGPRTVEDEADERAAEVRLQRSEEQYRLLFESNPVPMYVYNFRTLRIVAVNKAAVAQYGYSEQEFLEKSITEIRPVEDVADFLQDLQRHTAGLQQRGIWRHRRKCGEIFDAEIVCDSMDFRGIDSRLVAAYDVTERRRAESAMKRAEEKYRSIFEDAVIGIFQATPEGRLTNINRALAEMHGYESPEEMMAAVANVGRDLYVDPTRMLEQLQALASEGIVRGAEVEIYRKDHSRTWVRVNVRGVGDGDGTITMVEGTVEDITEHKAAQERVKFLAYYDALTELPHRALLQDRLENALAGARLRGEKIALLFLDLDRFKDVNDSYGHSFGDCVLKEVAQRLKESTQEHNTVARVGGDEFLILLSSVQEAADAAIVAEQVMEAMGASFVIQGQPVRVGCSVGVSVFPAHGEDGDTLIRNADAAMYSAKVNGRSNVRFFTDEMNAQAVERLTMDRNLRLALEREEFSLVYQPQMEIASGRIAGFEALIRWQHPELGPIAPERFIPVAEHNGLILPIGEWVLRTACEQARRWQDDGLAAVPVAVNVSAVQFRQEGFPELIRRVLGESGLAPEYLQLELTESLLLSNAEMTLAVLRELREMGVRLVIDDFGMGYSSFSYLRHFSAEKLKIDRSFVRDIVTNGDDAAITAAIISMGKSLRIKVIAEGVESEAQMAFLRKNGCDEIQGNYFSEPVPAGDVATMLSRDEASSAAADLDAAAGYGVSV
jgi:diguanylate cyclase (GGDEF)-like protein/PAS domain S-box-containing protein